VSFFSVLIFLKKKMKKNKKNVLVACDKPRASKRKIQQSAPLASTVSMVEKAKKPKAVSEEAAVSSPCPPEVAKGASATNVAEDERKIPALPKYVAVPREVFGAGPVAVEEAPSSVEVEAPNDVEEGEKGGAAKKTEKVEDKDKDNEVDDDNDASGNYVEEEEDNDGSDYTPDKEGSEGTINLTDDTVAPDNLLDKVKPGQKVSSPFDLPILPIAKTLLVKQGKKVPYGDEDSVLLLSNDEAEEATPLRSQKKKELATKLPAAGSSNKVGTAKSSKDVLMMIQGAQEEFFNLPWKSYVSVTFLFS
jgi:hypothetical protein